LCVHPVSFVHREVEGLSTQQSLLSSKQTNLLACVA
jgi:hypothetical protein